MIIIDILQSPSATRATTPRRRRALMILMNAFSIFGQHINVDDREPDTPGCA